MGELWGWVLYDGTTGRVIYDSEWIEKTLAAALFHYYPPVAPRG